MDIKKMITYICVLNNNFTKHLPASDKHCCSNNEISILI